MFKRSLKAFSLVLATCLIFSGLNAWTPAKRLTWTAGDTESPSLAIDSNDRIHILFSDETFGYPKNEIYHKSSTDGGNTWLALKRLTWNSGDSNSPCLAIDSNDYLHVVWSDDTSGNFEIYYKKSLNSGSIWGPNKRLTWNSSRSYKQSIATDSSGHIHVVWTELRATYDNDIYYKKSTDGGATWSSTQRLTWTTHGSTPIINIDTNNKIHVFYSDIILATYAAETFYKSSINSGSTWSPPKRLTWQTDIEWESETTTSVAINADNIHIVWLFMYFRFGMFPGPTNVFYKNSQNGGTTWGATKKLTWTPSSYEILTRSPAVAADSLNNPHVVWCYLISGDYEIYYKRSTNNGSTWGAPTRLTWNSGASWSPKIAIDSNNNVHVVWMDDTPGNKEIFYKKD